jgi:branched-chain amino acid transport system substrate-binding protein
LIISAARSAGSPPRSHEDDQQKPEVGKQKTDKLIGSDRVAFLTGYIWSNVLLASLKPAVDAQTFLISANAGPSQIAGAVFALVLLRVVAGRSGSAGDRRVP